MTLSKDIVCLLYTQFYDVSSRTNIIGVTELVSDRIFLLLQREAETSVRIANMHGYNCIIITSEEVHSCV